MPPLPVELLARIFIESLPPETYIKPDVDDVPLVLMRVCRRWRDVALRTTRLWCSLSAIEQYWSTLLPMHKARVDGYATWLSRSGSRPLSLAVPFPGPVIGRWGQEWVKLLRRYRARFEQLRVVDAYGVDLDDLLDSTQMLKLLEVSHDDAPDRHLAIARPPPSLRTLVLDSVNASPAALPGAAWGSLTHLAIRLPEDLWDDHLAGEFLGVVSRCPNLQALVFGRFSLERDEPDELQPQLQLPPSHPNLRLLTIVIKEDAAPQPASCMLILPALLHLRVGYQFSDRWEGGVVEDAECAAIPPPPECFFQATVVRNEDFHMFDVGWANITHLEVRFRGDVHALRTAIQFCPNVRVLTISGHRCSRQSTSLAACVTYPSLRDLFIAVDAPLGNVLQMVTLPGLQHLTIRAPGCGERKNLRAMLLRSRCALESLEVWETWLQRDLWACWTDEEREELSTLLPTLTALKLMP